MLSNSLYFFVQKIFYNKENRETERAGFVCPRGKNYFMLRSDPWIGNTSAERLNGMAC